LTQTNEHNLQPHIHTVTGSASLFGVGASEIEKQPKTNIKFKFAKK